MKNASKSVPTKISSEIKWLLDFANLGRSPGELSPPTPEIKERRLKEGKRDFDEKTDDFPEEKFSRLILEKGLPLSGGFMTHPEDLEDFKAKVKSADNGKVLGLWYEIRSSFFQMVNSRSINYFCDEFLTEYLHESMRPGFIVIDGEIVFSNNPLELSQSILSWFANFYLNDKNLHQLLMQCPACSRFWMKEPNPGPGAPRKYCDDRCKDVFNRLSKEKRNEIVRESRKQKRMHEELKKLISLLVESNIPKNQASKDAWAYIFKEEKRLKDHSNYKSYYGLA